MRILRLVGGAIPHQSVDRGAGSIRIFTAEMASLVMLCLLFLPTLPPRIARGAEFRGVWPQSDLKGVYEGDISLGGIFMVHDRDDEHVCGKIFMDIGIQPLEMMIYTLDYINNHMPDLLPGIRLGGVLIDDCDRDTVGVERSLQFVKSLNGEQCPASSSDQSRNSSNAVGVVGAASSVVSIQVASLLRLFKIPLVSYWSTSSELSNRERFDYFRRTVPSDEAQVDIMFSIINFFNWTYIQVVYEDSNYGLKASNYITEKLKEFESLCIAKQLVLPRDGGRGNSDRYSHILDQLLKFDDASVVIVFASNEEAKMLLDAARVKNASNFVWLGSDGWSGNVKVSQGNERFLEGAITIQPVSKRTPGFDDYFTSLRPMNASHLKMNPWFNEYWMTRFNCTIGDLHLKSPFLYNYKRRCTMQESLASSGNYQQNTQIQYVSDAVLALAYALHALWREECPGVASGLCAGMRHVDGERLLSHLQNATFQGLNNNTVYFEPNGDAPPNYKILNFQRVTSRDESGGSRDEWAYVKVGTVLAGEDLQLDLGRMAWREDRREYPLSRCSAPCPTGQVKRLQTMICCWLCQECKPDQYLKNDTHCETCPDRQMPVLPHRLGCVDIPIESVDFFNVYTLLSVCFATAGMLATTFVVAVYVKYSEAPAIKASARELCYILLAGVFLSYLVVFLLVLKPSLTVCLGQKAVIGFAFSLMYSSLLVKTNRIARIFDSANVKATRPQLISPQSQVMITGILNGAEVLVIVMWFMMSPPTAELFSPASFRLQLICTDFNHVSFVTSATYPLLLLACCTYYAVKTRKIPEAFNESKHIGLTVYTTCVVWAAFFPIFFMSADNLEIRTITLSVTSMVSGTVVLACLFAPKLYHVLVKREVALSRTSTTNSKIRFKTKLETTQSQAANEPQTPSATNTATAAKLPGTVTAQISSDC